MVSRHALFACAVLGIPAFAGCAAVDRPQPDSHTVSGSGVPVITAVAPDNAAGGDSVTVTGQGFSFVAQENVIALGNSAVSANDYQIADDGIETITFDVPSNAEPGDTDLIVIVEGNASNSIPFSVAP